MRHANLGYRTALDTAQQMRSPLFFRPIKDLRKLSASCPLACKQILWITNFRKTRAEPRFSAHGTTFARDQYSLLNQPLGMLFRKLSTGL